MKSGIVALIGRPNVGKSTLLNALLGQKVSITSPKPQTTRFSIQAVYNDDHGQIIFVDTPGIFGKVEDSLAKKINPRAEQSLSQGVHAVVYMIDPTRKKDFEENKTLGIVRKIDAPKILVYNKIDKKKPDFTVEYKFIQDEVDAVVKISALRGTNIPTLISTIYEYLPDGEPLVDTSQLIQPGLNIDSRTFLSELIREKAFLFLRREVPYTLTTVVDEFAERDNGTFYLKGRILVSNDKYKKMVIGKGGSMIKEISMAVRKELELARNQKAYIDLTVETDPHWVEMV